MNDNKAFAIFIIAASVSGATMVSISSYNESKVKEKEIELKIEQQKTMQLKYKKNAGKD
jgi:Mn2+/Fe2+ NRAMP family transporter